MGNQWDQGGDQKFLETNENEHTKTQNLWGSVKIGHSTIGQPQEAGKISNKQSNTTPKWTRKTITNKAQSKEKEGNNKDQSSNQWQRLKKIQKINETRHWFFEKMNKIGELLTRLINKW